VVNRHNLKPERAMPNATQDVDRSLCIIAVTEETASATTPTAVYGALTKHLPMLVHAAGAVVYERRQQTREHWAFLPVAHGAAAPARFFSAVWPISNGGRLRREDVPDDSPYGSMFQACGSPAAVVFTPVGEEAVLVLTFDDAASMPVDTDWRVVQGLALQAASAIERISALQRLHELTLEDADTGLGNRRLVEVVLKHSFAQASRGEPLSVVGIRPRSGDVEAPRRDTPAADVQRRIAELLREHARASDTVARFDDGVFVILLRASSAAGAEVFLRRVLDGAGDAALNCVVTEFDGRFESPQALLKDVVNRVKLAQSGD
jgi:GGDEF domain-containing protein